MPLFLRNILWSPCNENVTWSCYIKNQKNECLNFGGWSWEWNSWFTYLFSGCCHPEVFFSKGLAYFSKCAKLLQVLQQHASIQMLHISTASWNIFYKQFKYSPTQTPFPTLCTGMRCYNDSWNHCTSLCKLHKEQGLICNPSLLQFTSFVKIGLLTKLQHAHSSVLTSPRLL